ncbi:hypothetical protein ACFYYS_18105 [Streptomyces sp. NPDC002120]|uniref:hypothetical protein n=1 Tax=Streptomyces sp. NPDC002120 TaxID=3364631 RepID=UPI0036B1D3EC
MAVLGVVATLGGGATWWLVALAVAGALVTEVTRRWFGFRTAARREAEHTRRVLAAVGGTESVHRAEVVRACAVLAPMGGRPGVRGGGGRR